LASFFFEPHIFYSTLFFIELKFNTGL
jgi:hypothetical protein